MRHGSYTYKDNDPIPETVAGMHNLLLQIFESPEASRAVHVKHDLNLGGLAQHHQMSPTEEITLQWHYPRKRKRPGFGGFM